MEKDKKDVITHKEAEKLGVPRQPIFVDGIDVNTIDSEYIPKFNKKNSNLIRRFLFYFFILLIILLIFWFVLGR
jgi:hypothetical protein